MASILEISIEEVEQEYDCSKFLPKGEVWFWELQKWLFERGLGVIILQYDGCSILPHNCYHIVTGKSPKGDFNHSVVYFGDVRVHDPNPDNIGLKNIKDSIYLIPIFPKLNEASC